MKKSYVQASKSNISQKVEDVLQLKEAFPSLSVDEVGKILKVKDSGESNKKPRINMTTRGPLRREVIIPMTKVNAELIINSAHIHISNVNKCLKNSKSDTFADFIRFNVNRITITTNKPASGIDLSTIEKYLKNIENVNPESIESPCLPKSKSYVRRGSHRGGSPQNGLGDEWTCGTTLASAYVLCHLSAVWSQLQMKERKSKWK